MPTYEYVCRDCSEHLEVVQSFRDDPLATCGKCGGSLRKVFTPAGIIFKGSGFYSTDNRTSQPASSQGSASSAASDDSSGSSDSGSGGSESSGSPEGGSGSSDSGSGSSEGGSGSSKESGSSEGNTGTASGSSAKPA